MLALAVVAIWSITISLPVPEAVRSRVSFDNNSFRFGFSLPWWRSGNRVKTNFESCEHENILNERKQQQPFVIRQLRDNIAKMGLAFLAFMQPVALVPPFVSAVDDARRRYFDSSRSSLLTQSPLSSSWIRPSHENLSPTSHSTELNSSDNLFVKAITSPLSLFRPVTPRTIAMTSPILTNSQSTSELAPESTSKSESAVSGHHSIVRTSLAMVTLAAAAVIQPVAFVGPFMNILDSFTHSLSSNANEERVATATYTPTSDHLFMRIRSFIPQLSIPFFGATMTSDRFENWSFELPQFDLPRFIGRVRMAVAVHNANGMNHEQAHPFKLNGLRWHHCAISNHLRAIEKYAANGASGAEVEAAYSFVFAKIWRTYNNLERDIFFPWLVSGTHNDPHVQNAVNEFAAERSRIERAANRIRSTITALMQCDPTMYEHNKLASVSNVRRERLTRQLRGLAIDVERLHKAERDVLFPIIAARFSVPEQRKLTNRMVDAMENRLSRLQLVNYYENIKNDPVQVAHFKDEVPAPLRALLGFWKMSYYDGTPLESLSQQ